MGQLGSKLRRGNGFHSHWCPACEEVHSLPDTGWEFDGNLDAPTFRPSFKHSGYARVTANGKWTGEWVRDAEGKPVPWVCHYILAAGVLNFCGDCTHGLAGKAVPLPELPEHLKDQA